jgi:hypothetical protein
VRILSLDGRACLEEEAEGAIGDARSIGARVAQALLARGAGPLVAGT